MGDAGAVGRADGRAREQREHPARLEIDTPAPGRPERAEPDLRALQILQDGDRAAPTLLSEPDLANHLGVLAVGAVREVHARHVHTGGNEAIEERGATAGGPDGADDLGAAHAANPLSEAAPLPRSRGVSTRSPGIVR